MAREIKPWVGAALLLAMAALFLGANHAAYSGYFQDDDLDNLSWTPLLPWTVYAEAALTPRFQANNFRPVGHFFYHAMGLNFGLDFSRYIIAIHAIHLLNVWILWLLVRKLGASPLAASAAGLFFGFHMMLFDIFWKPAYVFDLLCGSFVLLSLLLYVKGRWVVSFLAFWLAYKAKEVAVMLPFVLAIYEMYFGERRWKRLIPFFAASLSFGLQGVLLNPNRDNDYTFRFTLPAVWATVSFYGSRLLLVRYLGWIAIPFAVYFGGKRTRFGLLALLLFFMPMLFLPNHLYFAYCYVPFTGAAIAISEVVEKLRPRTLLIGMVLWVAVNSYQEYRTEGRVLPLMNDIRTYVATLTDFVGRAPEIDSFVYDGAPMGFRPFGIPGVLRFLRGGRDARVAWINDASSAREMAAGPVAVLRWDALTHRLSIDVSRSRL